MTINGLHEELIRRVEKDLDRMACLAGKRLKGYAQALPILELDEEEDKLFPYVAVRTTSVDIGKTESRTETYLFFGIKEENLDNSGYFTLLSILERSARSFQEDCTVGVFWCEREMEMVLQEDDSYPYFFGYLKMNWNIPDMTEIMEDEVTI